MLYYLPDTFATENIQPIQSLLTLAGQPSAMGFQPDIAAVVRRRHRGTAARLEHWIVPSESLVQARQDVLKRIAAARARAGATATSIDPGKISDTLAAVETTAPKAASA